jgi:hypothetical protein
VQVAECLPSKHKALSSNPSIPKKGFFELISIAAVCSRADKSVKSETTWVK